VAVVDHRERLLANSAREQRGLFTIAQALACGFSDRTVVARASSGMYETVHPGVYGVAGSAVTWEREVLAAVLSATDPAAASHRTAAYLLGLTSQKPPVVEVITNRHQRVKRREFVVHESKDLIGSDIRRVDGLPVTSAVRTVVDLGASAPPRFVERCLDTGLRKKFFTAWDVRCFIARVARSGRTGVGTIRPLIDERLTWQGLTESALEDVFRTLVVRATLPMPDPQHVVHDHGWLIRRKIRLRLPGGQGAHRTRQRGIPHGSHVVSA